MATATLMKKKNEQEVLAKQTNEQQAKQIISAANNSLAELLCREAKANCGLARIFEQEERKMSLKPKRNDTSYG